MNATRDLRHPDPRLSPQEGEGIVLHLEARRYFGVSDSGLTLLEALKEAQTTGAFLDQCLACSVVVETKA